MSTDVKIGEPLLNKISDRGIQEYLKKNAAEFIENQPPDTIKSVQKNDWKNIKDLQNTLITTKSSIFKDGDEVGYHAAINEDLLTPENKFGHDLSMDRMIINKLPTANDIELYNSWLRNVGIDTPDFDAGYSGPHADIFNSIPADSTLRLKDAVYDRVKHSKVGFDTMEHNINADALLRSIYGLNNILNTSWNRNKKDIETHWSNDFKERALKEGVDVSNEFSLSPTEAKLLGLEWDSEFGEGWIHTGLGTSIYPLYTTGTEKQKEIFKESIGYKAEDKEPTFIKERQDIYDPITAPYIAAHTNPYDAPIGERYTYKGRQVRKTGFNTGTGTLQLTDISSGQVWDNITLTHVKNPSGPDIKKDGTVRKDWVILKDKDRSFSFGKTVPIGTNLTATIGNLSEKGDVPITIRNDKGQIVRTSYARNSKIEGGLGYGYNKYLDNDLLRIVNNLRRDLGEGHLGHSVLASSGDARPVNFDYIAGGTTYYIDDAGLSKLGKVIGYANKDFVIIKNLNDGKTYDVQVENLQLDKSWDQGYATLLYPDERPDRKQKYKLANSSTEVAAYSNRQVGGVGREYSIDREPVKQEVVRGADGRIGAFWDSNKTTGIATIYYWNDMTGKYDVEGTENISGLTLLNVDPHRDIYKDIPTPFKVGDLALKEGGVSVSIGEINNPEHPHMILTEDAMGRYEWVYPDELKKEPEKKPEKTERVDTKYGLVLNEKTGVWYYPDEPKTPEKKPEAIDLDLPHLSYDPIRKGIVEEYSDGHKEFIPDEPKTDTPIFIPKFKTSDRVVWTDIGVKGTIIEIDNKDKTYLFEPDDESSRIEFGDSTWLTDNQLQRITKTTPTISIQDRLDPHSEIYKKPTVDKTLEVIPAYHRKTIDRWENYVPISNRDYVITGELEELAEMRDFTLKRQLTKVMHKEELTHYQKLMRLIK